MKVVTISGSMRFEKEMREIARKLESEYGYCVLQTLYGKLKHTETIDQMHNIVNSQCKKIELSNALYVVNIGGYIGETTRQEIEYAERHCKEIIYHEPLKHVKKK